MKSRTLRRLLFAASAVALLGVGAAAWLLSRSDAIEQALLGQISNSLLTRGHITDIELSLWDDFPLISLSMSDVWLAGSGEGGPGAGPFSGDTLLRAKRLGLTLDALSLMGDEPRIEAVHVRGATLVLAQRRDGAWNTEVWKTTETETAFSFQIDRLHLEDVHVQVGEYGATIDRSTCRGSYRNDDLQATVDATLLAYQQPVDVHFEVAQKGEIWECSQLALKALGARATGSMALAGKNPRLELDVQGLEAKRLVRALGFDGDDAWSADAVLSGAVGWDGTTWTGHAKPTQGQLDLPQGLNPWWNEAPSNPLDGSWSGTVWFRYSDSEWRVDVPQLELALPGFTATAEVSWTPRALELKGDLLAEPAAADFCAPIEDLHWQTGTLTSTFAVVQKDQHLHYDLHARLVQSSGTWGDHPWSAAVETRIQPDRLDVLQANLHWNTENWNVSGTLLDPWTDGPLRGQLKASAPRMVLAPNANAQPSPWWNDLDLPPGSHLTASADIQEIIYQGVRLTGSQVELLATPQRLDFDAQAEAWDGHCSAFGTLQWHPTGARMDLNYVAQAVSVRRLFEAFDNFGQTTLRSEHVDGRIDSDGTAVAEWHPEGTLASDRLRWSGSQTLNDGKLIGVEALMSIPDYLSAHRMAAPLIHPTDLRAKLDEIELKTVSGPAYFFDNSFHVPSTILQSDELHVTVAGTHSLSGDIDYSIGLELRELRGNKSDDIGDIQDDGLGNHLFIKILGSVDEPEFRWDRESQREHRRKDFQAERDKLKALWDKKREY